MKKIIIHVGTHKTATSSFQRYCYKFRDILSERGVCYPLIKGYENVNSHFLLARSLEQTSRESAKSIMNNIFNEFNEDKNHTLLLSSEDFENSLVGSEQLDHLMAAARKFKFNTFEAVIVARRPYDYLFSIYSELSKQKTVLNFSEIAEAVIKYGYFVSTSSDFNYYFAIKTLLFAKRFAARHPSMKVRYFNFTDFVTGFPGKPLLTSIIGSKATNLMERVGLKSELNNKKLEPFEVELNYAKNMFNLMPEDKDIPPDTMNLLTDIANKRLALIHSLTKELSARL